MARRSPARRRPVHRRRAYGKEWGMGKQRVDDVTGCTHPERLMMQDERGRWVSKDRRDGGLDRPDNY